MLVVLRSTALLFLLVRQNTAPWRREQIPRYSLRPVLDFLQPGLASETIDLLKDKQGAIAME